MWRHLAVAALISFLVGLGLVAYRLQPWQGLKAEPQPTRKPADVRLATPEPAPTWTPTPPVWTEPPRPRPTALPTPRPTARPTATPTLAPARRRRPPGMYDPLDPPPSP